MLIKCPGQSKDKMKKSPKTVGEHAGGSKGIRAPRGVGRTHDVLIFIATVAFYFWPHKSQISACLSPIDTQ